MEIQKIASLEDLQCLIENQDIVYVNGRPHLYRWKSCDRFSFTRRVDALGAVGVIDIKTENLRFHEGGIEANAFYPDFYYKDIHPIAFARESNFLKAVGL